MSTILNVIIGFVVYIMIYSIVMKICDTVITCFKIKYRTQNHGYSRQTNVEDLYPKE